jgi:hypothetical protein
MNIDTIADRVIAVDYGKPFADMIAAGRYDYANSNITAEKFPVEGTGTKQSRARLFHFGRFISSEDAVAAITKENFMPADHVHGLCVRSSIPRGTAQAPHCMSRFVRAGVRSPGRHVPPQVR